MQEPFLQYKVDKLQYVTVELPVLPEYIQKGRLEHQKQKNDLIEFLRYSDDYHFFEGEETIGNQNSRYMILFRRNIRLLNNREEQRADYRDITGRSGPIYGTADGKISCDRSGGWQKESVENYKKSLCDGVIVSMEEYTDATNKDMCKRGIPTSRICFTRYWRCRPTLLIITSHPLRRYNKNKALGWQSAPKKLQKISGDYGLKSPMVGIRTLIYGLESFFRLYSFSYLLPVG